MIDRCRSLRWAFAVLASLSVLAVSQPATAQTAAWSPQHNVEIIVPTAAGSSMDLLARLIQDILKKDGAIATPITVQAKPGASGAVAWSYVSGKTGDGHYLAISGPTLLSNELLGVGSMTYKDITPIAQLFTEYEVFAVAAQGPIKTGANLVAALQQPTPPSVGVAPGYGGSSHVALIKLARTAHIDPNSLTIVPFKGANESVNALLGGHIDVAIATMSVVAPFIEAGKLRAIGIAAPKRLPGSEASIPTWTEQGFKVVEGNWRGIVGPKDLNAAEVAYWGGKIATVVKSKAWAESLKRYDWDADYADSNGSRQFLDVRYDELRSTLATLKLAK
ncbi:MAG TPA: tripartite tricarboxylate transporter substrate binding protein [Pseudolabrys sp.]|nr:tripartite tricarboxylate transporter substrate binding protein [Pseudolabrys sp.]